MARDTPDTQYARLGDASIAYQVIGAGPLDVLVIPNWVTHVEGMWEIPGIASGLERMAGFARVVVYDQLGTGLSDPLSADDMPTLEDRTDEARTVLDAAGVDRACVVGFSAGGPIAIMTTATFPERFHALALANTSARWRTEPGYEIGASDEALDRMLDRVLRTWGNAGDVRPGEMRHEREKWARYQRMAASPGTVRAMIPVAIRSDVRGALGAISVPTAVFVAPVRLKFEQPMVISTVDLVAHGRFLAEHIPGAQYVEISNPDPDEPPPLAAFLDDVEEFFTGSPRVSESNRVLATVLFSDIVGSTERAASLGDAKWKELLDAHDDVVRRQLSRFQGREVKTLGDGFLATFDGPARSIRCAKAIRDGAQRLDVNVRIGIHTGECEVRGDDVGGIAVHIAARVSANAAPLEILVSRTVCDLVAGSGLTFEDRGLHSLKGVPGEWQLFAAAD
jgi:class 3 adenylate cyclase